MPSSVVDRVAGLNVEGNGLASQGLHEDLHRCCKLRIELFWVLGGQEVLLTLGPKSWSMPSVGFWV